MSRLVEDEAISLNERLSLIEHNIKAGRRTTENYGWTFLAWGLAIYAAIFWSWKWHTPQYAWPVCMIGTAIFVAISFSMRGRKSNQPATFIGRAIGSIWCAVGASMFLFGFTAGFTQHAGPIPLQPDGHAVSTQIFICVIMLLLAVANGASALILKWWPQFIAALVWWIAAGCMFFVKEQTALIVYLVALFLGQIVFGTYLMISERKWHHA